MAIEIKGLDSLMAKLNAMGGNVIDALGEAVATTGIVAQADARAFVAVDTGALKASISSDIDFTATSVEATVFTNNPYALYQEMGTVKMAAHPYMMPALNDNKSTFEYLAKRELNKAIRKAAK
jgi:HK97 gp10 family phage protein